MMTRLRSLMIPALVAMASLFAGGAEATDTSRPVIVGQIASPTILDPHRVTSLSDFRVLANIFEGLVRYRRGSLDIEPALAESWTVSGDGRRYRFKLRDGAVFHDGAPVDAESVKFNIDRMIDPAHPYHGTGPFPLAFFFTMVDRVTALDRLTVEIELSQPFSPFLSNLAYPAGFLVSPAAVAKHGAAFIDNPSGAGPFRFAGRASDGGVKLEPNPTYWGGPAASGPVQFRPIADAGARARALESGEIDIALEADPSDARRLGASPGFVTHDRAGPHLWFVILNTRSGAFRHRALRQAVNYAVNKNRIAEDLLHGGLEVAAGPIAPAFSWAHDAGLDPYPYDPDRARALIALSDYSGETLRFLVPETGAGMLSPVAMGEAIQKDLEAVGVNATVSTLPWPDYLQRVNAGLGDDVDMAAMAWMTNDPDTLLSLALRGGAFPERGGFNSGYYFNGAADRLVGAARRTAEIDLRARLYRDVQAYVTADAPWLFVGSWRQSAVVSEQVDGFDLEPSFFLRLDGVSRR